MRRPVLAVMTGLTAVVLGLGLRAGAHDTTKASGAAVGLVQAPTGSSSSPSDAPSASPSAAPSAASARVNGEAAGTRYGPVQVQITVRAGKVVAADAIVYPTQDRRDQEINSYAIPQLDDEVVQAQSAQIDTVSGATYTSEGYVRSLQSAIDQAHSAGLL
jgi:uncharacterized protein with FMN-binding domain